MKTYVLIFCVAVCLPVFCSGAVIHVPGDQATIQEGINAAVDGDTVLVANGIYPGFVMSGYFIGDKSIYLFSENGPSSCIIDGKSSDDVHGFFFSNAGYSVLRGFTIRYFDSTSRDGAGIHCRNSSIVIENCIITHNETISGRGGGVYFSEVSYPVINNCTITENSASFGGGIYMHDDSLIILSCTTIAGNIGTTNGGGIFIDDVPGNGGTLALTNCILWGDSANGSSNEFSGVTDIVIVYYSDIQGGWTGTGNIDSNPLFVTGPCGEYYLSQTIAGQGSDSPCQNAGNNLAANVFFGTSSDKIYMSELTTRTDLGIDNGIVDIGYHYLPFTPVPIPTQTPIPAVSCEIVMPSDEYYLGDWFECKVAIINPSSNKTYVDFPTFVVLDVYGLYFFAPSFNSDLDYYENDIPPGNTEIQVIPGFYWPWGAGSGSATWIAGVVTPDFSQLFGAYDTFEFNWSE